MEILCTLLLASFNLCFCQHSSFKLWNVTLPYPMSDFAVGINNNKLTIVGNSIVQVEYDLVLSVAKNHMPAWTNKTLSYIPFSNISDPSYNLVYLFEGQTVVQNNNFIYGINPYLDPGYTLLTPYQYNTMLIYDLNSHSWVDISTYKFDTPYAAESPCVVTHNDLIYVIGGAGYIGYTGTKIYNINKDYWYNGSNINIPRAAAGCSLDSTNSSIYIFGGWQDMNTQNHTALNTIERYDINNINDDSQWVLLNNTRMPHGVRDVFCTLYLKDNNIYCVGGINIENIGVNYVQIFNTNDYSWKMSYLHYSRFRTNIQTYNNDCMMVLGGFGGWDWLDSIETLNCNFSNNA